AIQADHLRARYQGAHFLLHALRPDSELLDPRAAARRASLRRFRLATAAAVADQRAIEVVRVRDLARRTLRDVPAVTAEDHRREPAAIQIEDRLIARGDGALQRLAECLRKRPAVACPELETKIHDRRRRKRQLADALRKSE